MRAPGLGCLLIKHATSLPMLETFRTCDGDYLIINIRNTYSVDYIAPGTKDIAIPVTFVSICDCLTANNV